MMQLSSWMRAAGVTGRDEQPFSFFAVLQTNDKLICLKTQAHLCTQGSAPKGSDIFSYETQHLKFDTDVTSLPLDICTLTLTLLLWSVSLHLHGLHLNVRVLLSAWTAFSPLTMTQFLTMQTNTSAHIKI